MPDDAAHRARYLSAFAREVVAPAVFGPTVALDAEVFTCDDHRTPDAAADGPFAPVELGWRWGPVWSSAWFRVRGSIPPAWRGRAVVLRFSAGTEATVWDGGVPRQGFDANRDVLHLADASSGDEAVDVLIEAACTQPLGATNFWWDAPEVHARWKEPLPGRFERCELSVYHDGPRRLAETLEFAAAVIASAPDADLHATRLHDVTVSVISRIDPRDPGANADARIDEILTALRDDGGASTGVCFGVGHAHIDTAWLWPISETRRKCLRTFATALRLLDRHDDFHFLCSQPQQYAWIRERAPELFDEIAARVREGRWEPLGAMWVEPDCNLPSGESLIRQIMEGTTAWREMFGADVPQRLLYLPDTFGFLPALPQIMRGCGIDTFITNKLSWSQTNRFPFVTFRWRGIDGSEVLTHLTPGHDYNSTVEVADFRRGAENLAVAEQTTPRPYLQPFGYGDGGGGPTEAMIERVRLADQTAGLSGANLRGTAAFVEALHDAVGDASGLPVWDGELYLELHRGTYTTQAWLKAANRRAEIDLRTAEWLATAGPVGRTGDASTLREAWRRLLLNQFHDILPGTSIAAVYDDARADLAFVGDATDALIDTAASAWLTTRDRASSVAVLNPTSTAWSGVIDLGGTPTFVRDVPALGGRIVDPASSPDVEPVSVKGRSLSNGLVQVTIDGDGHVVSLTCGDTELRRPDGPPLNVLRLYRDHPRAWEAWDIDPEYRDSEIADAVRIERCEIVESHPLRAAIEVEGSLGASSRIVQRFVVRAGSSRVDVETDVDWQEDRRLFRVEFPVDVRASAVTAEIQFGHHQRPTHANTSWERARYEWCAHQWVDLSQPGAGLALLNDGKYGHSCHGHVLGMTLLRAPRFPDPRADRGRQRFTYALLPHDGDWRSAGVVEEARRLNTRPLVFEGAETLAGGHRSWAPFDMSVDGAATVEVVAVKPAESGDAVIVRLVEVHGGRGSVRINWNLPVTRVSRVDLLEQATDGAAPGHTPTRIDVRPFEIVTLRVELETNP